MKKLVLILLFFPVIGFGQNVFIPDVNFKAYLVNNSAINTNGDAEIQVQEASLYNSHISPVGLNISDLTGIEAFTSITDLFVYTNQLTSIDLSQNINLNSLSCSYNQLTSLDLSQNIKLTSLFCENNPIISLDLSNNDSLWLLQCGDSTLECLNIANGNNLNFSDCWISPSSTLLYCIEADDSLYMNNNWNQHFNTNSLFGSQWYFSNNCNNSCSSIISSIPEQLMDKKVIKVTDILGRETKYNNQLLFYIYKDGTVEKKIIIDK